MLLYERSKVAIEYMESKLGSDAKEELINLFSKYNEEIIKIIGLHTL